MHQRFIRKTAALLMSLFILLGSLPGTAGAEAKGRAKNVILLIPDGMGISYMTAARIFKGEELSFERYVKGLMKTYSADTNITDSAAAGTAMATGYKTNNGMISVTPEGKQPSSILDAAREKGKGTGLVATSRITHATPAVFTAHDPSRGNEVAIALDYIGNVDVILGGGRDMFLPQKDGGNQPERDLIAEAKDQGYDYITSRSDLNRVTGDKVLGLFDMSDLKYDIDRDQANVPSLAEMTGLAVDVLSRNDQGFFLMVEGSQIDWAGHANDPVALIHDVLAFEEAVNVALEFAKKDGNTLVVIVGDHETGGINIGNTAGGYKENIAVLKKAKGSANAVRDALKKQAVQLPLGSAKQVDGRYYMPVREWVRELKGELVYDEAASSVQVSVNGTAFAMNLLNETIVQGEETEEGIYFLEEGTAYIDVQKAATMIGLQAGIGTVEGEPGKTKAYIVDIRKVMEPIVGLELTESDLQWLTSVNWESGSALSNEVGTVISAHALISWGSRHHTGEEVPLYAYGIGADEFVGLIDNTDLPRILSYLMGVEHFSDETEFMQKLENRRNH
ncbi:alkaline phosphatase [Paenibacillus sp. SAFN-117]|uniref:alkaline phosphatase n=1 Tax=Paenibacillus sp. SAFN-117 TaxID=3436860 RepID=UPI003F815F8F